ncbi:hypothetical protein B0H11DRAFT_2274093 [Mycena galericulata]|nr:hypothetical protein B0H11DRAFT_2274093 [Mycena galericulata]
MKYASWAKMLTISPSSHHVASLPVPNPHLFRTHWPVLDPSSLKPQGSKPAAPQLLCVKLNECFKLQIFKLPYLARSLAVSLKSFKYGWLIKAFIKASVLFASLAVPEREPTYIQASSCRAYVFIAASPSPVHTRTSTRPVQQNDCAVGLALLPYLFIVSPVGQTGRLGQRRLTYTSRTGGGLDMAALVVPQLAQIAGKGARIGGRLSASGCSAGAWGRPPTRGVRGQ